MNKIDLALHKRIQRCLDAYYHETGGVIGSDDHSVSISLTPPPTPEGVTWMNRFIQKMIDEMVKVGIHATYSRELYQIRISSEDPELIEEIKDMLLISSPIVDHDREVPYRKVAEAQIPHGRVLFRGDAREPEDIFENGMKPNHVPPDSVNNRQTVLSKAFVSSVGLTLALTPYLNTAAIFPIRDTEKVSETWVYMMKLDNAFPIAHHSLMLREDGKFGSASYPAEVITHLVPPERIICAVRVRRNWVPYAMAAAGQPNGDFTIEEIRMNSKCTVHLDDVSMKEYLQYLENQKKEKTSIPFRLSEQPTDAMTSFNQSQGIIELSADLIAQNSEEYPAEAIKKWLALFSNRKEPLQKEIIENTINQYPRVLRILNPVELSYLLKSYPSIDNSAIFSALKNTNDLGLSALSAILTNKPARDFGESDKAFNAILIYFSGKDTGNQFIELVAAASPNIKNLGPNLILEAMANASSAYKKAFLNMLVIRLYADDFPLHDSIINKSFQAIIQLIKAEPESAPLYEELINQLVRRQISEEALDMLALVISDIAKQYSSSENTIFFEMIINAVKKYRPEALIKISSPTKNLAYAWGSEVSPIIFAIKAGNIKLVTLWMQAGASLRDDVTIFNKNTPLMTAIRYKQPAIALLILSQGKHNAGLDLKNKQGKTVTDLMTDEHNTDDWDIVRKKIDRVSHETEAATQSVHSVLRSSTVAPDVRKDTSVEAPPNNDKDKSKDFDR